MASSGVEDVELSEREDDSGVAEGYDIQLFVELPPKDLICAKCEKVLREPHQAECGHLYCAQCISDPEDVFCLCCGRNLRSRAYSKDYQRDRRILELRVHCPERGCQWEGELQNLEIHGREQCAYRVVECEFRYAGCMARGTASEMKEHVEHDTQQHLRFVAKHFQAQLEQQRSLQRERSVAGAQQEERGAPQPEHRAGGGDMGQQEGQGEARLEERQTVALPRLNFFGLLIIAVVVVPMLAIAYQYGASSLQNDILNLKAEMDGVSHKLENLQAQLDEVKQMDAIASHKWSSLENKYMKLSKEYMAIANSSAASVMSLQSEVEAISLHVQDQMRTLNEENVKSKSMVKEIEETLTETEQKVNSTDVRLAKMEAEQLHTSEISAAYRYLPLEIAIPAYQPTAWQSAPFYTHLQGYKMHVLINGTSPNTNLNLRQETFGVYLQIEPGEFDGTLTWPSDLELTVHLLHPKGDHYQPERSIRLRVFPDGLSGWNEYIAPKKATRYITNNLLHFKVFKLL